uniref:Protein transport protein SEC23 n=1 Tax=Lotharella oceanica TaxID=641309 RepID=A0A7S2TMZ0_9EUKA|mmetsp:Transcript_21641/g.40536  ORF Transcript_21641/g.40536 Transcript_21641/m.40536 type:complete len:540 (+) Transcript_21641:3-1622(+)
MQRREDVEYQLNTILEDLTKDAWPHKNDQRPARCSGAALNVAVSLLEATSKGHNARIMLFNGGPPTIGPGLVVSQEKKDTIRSHADIVKGKVPHYHKALEYYAKLGERAAACGHIIDIFAGAMDQTGVAEMRGATVKTGGFVVLDDAFEGDVFKGSFARMFVTESEESKALAMCFSGQIDVKCSPDVKVCGAIGAAYPLEKKSSCIAEREVGLGGTSCWAIGGCDPGYTCSFYYDVVNQDSKNHKEQCYLQFATIYKNSSGQTIQRVTTISKLFADIKTKDGFESLKLGFDQEAAAVLMARHAVYKIQSEYEFTMDILRWLDRRLIMLVKMFAEYQKENPESFRLSEEFMYYPGFMFHLRRSNFLKVFNSTPDETVFYRGFLLRENVTNSLVMIQPTLMAYSLEEGACQPVYLDVSSISPDKILLLDDFFHVVIFYGSTVHDWLTQEIWKQPDYAYLEEFFQGPQEDAKALLQSRLPTPIFVSCAQNGSQSRFLMSKLNPSITQNNVGQYGSGGAPPVFTDDVSLKVFLDHLKKLAVAP